LLSIVHNRAHIMQFYHYNCGLLLYFWRKLQVRCARRSCSNGRPYLTSPTHPVEIFRNCRFTSSLLYTIWRHGYTDRLPSLQTVFIRNVN